MKTKVSITGQTYRTNDYSIFKRLLGNREVKSARVNKIKTSIEKYGYIYNPIVINEKYEVIDGQGRLEALELLGLPVDFVVSEGTGLEECIALNASFTNWNMNDYIDSYCEMGNSNYILLDSLCKKYPSLKLNIITQIATGKVANSNNAIKAGTFKINKDNMKEIERDLNVAAEVTPIFNVRVKGNTQYYIYACVFAYRHGADLGRIIDVLNREIIAPAPDIKTALNNLSDLYNKNLKKKDNRIRLYYLYDDEMTNKYGWYQNKWSSVNAEVVS